MSLNTAVFEKRLRSAAGREGCGGWTSKCKKYWGPKTYNKRQTSESLPSLPFLLLSNTNPSHYVLDSQFFQCLPGHPQYPLPREFSIMCPPLVLSLHFQNISISLQLKPSFWLCFQLKVESIPSIPTDINLVYLSSGQIMYLPAVLSSSNPSLTLITEWIQNTNENMPFPCLKLFNMFPSLTGSRSSSLYGIWNCVICISRIFPAILPSVTSFPTSTVWFGFNSLWAHSMCFYHSLYFLMLFHLSAMSFPGVSQGELSCSLFMHRSLF